jgi:D-alanyl-D-alanine carboxypeptidase
MMFRFVISIIFFSSLFLSAVDMDFKPVTADDVSILLYDIEKGEDVLAVNADKPFYYASNLKLLTSAAALNYLGGGFRFMTLFAFDPAEGVLYIKAAGDPEMVIEKLWVMANDFKRRGIKDIKRVVVDDFIYGPKVFRSLNQEIQATMLILHIYRRLVLTITLGNIRESS